MTVLSDQPELIALSGLASVEAPRVARAFNDPRRFFEYITLEELKRLQGAAERFAALSQSMIAALNQYKEFAKHGK